MLSQQSLVFFVCSQSSRFLFLNWFYRLLFNATGTLSWLLRLMKASISSGLYPDFFFLLAAVLLFSYCAASLLLTRYHTMPVVTRCFPGRQKTSPGDASVYTRKYICSHTYLTWNQFDQNFELVFKYVKVMNQFTIGNEFNRRVKKCKQFKTVQSSESSSKRSVQKCSSQLIRSYSIINRKAIWREAV